VKQQLVVTLLAVASLTVGRWQARLLASRLRLGRLATIGSGPDFPTAKILAGRRTAKLPEVEREIRCRRRGSFLVPVASGISSSQERACVRVTLPDAVYQQSAGGVPTVGRKHRRVVLRGRL
jgi:hypothetical protein